MLQKKKKKNVNSNSSRVKSPWPNPFGKIFVAQPISQYRLRFLFVLCDKQTTFLIVFDLYAHPLLLLLDFV